VHAIRTDRLTAILLGATLLLMGCAAPSASPIAPTTSLEWQPLSAEDADAAAGPTPQPAVALPAPAPMATPTRAQAVNTGKVAQKGSEAPDFALSDLQGNEVALSSFRGKVVLLNFFATWCPPCNAELPDLQTLHADYQDRGLAIVAVNQAESATTVARFVDDNQVPFTVLLDANAAVSRQYNVRAIPRSLFIDADGVLVIDHLGYMSDEQMRAYVEQLLD